MAPSKDARDAALAAARHMRVKALAEELRGRLPIGELLHFVMAFTQFWINEAVALEGDTSRGSKGRRDDCRVAARLADALCSDLESLSETEPTPADAAVVEYLSAATVVVEPTPARTDEYKLDAAVAQAFPAPFDAPKGDAPSQQELWERELHQRWEREQELLLPVPGADEPKSNEEYEVSATPFVNPAPVTSAPAAVGRVLTFADLRAQPASSPPLHRSYSQLESYADCGLKYRLQRREPGVIQRPSWALVGGIALHSTIETLERGTPQGSASGHSDDAAEALWSGCLNDAITAQALKAPEFGMDSWHAPARGAEGYTWWLHEGFDMVKRYRAWRGAMHSDGWRVAILGGLPGIEWPFEIIISGNRVVGKIDLIMESEAGSLMVVDFKGGKNTPTDTLQLKTYSVAVGSPRPIGAYLMLRTGRLLQHLDVAAPAVHDELAWRYGGMDTAERGGVYMARPSSYCGGCSVKHACPVLSGS